MQSLHGHLLILSFFNAFVKALSDLAFFILSGINTQIFGPNYRKHSSLVQMNFKIKKTTETKCEKYSKIIFACIDNLPSRVSYLLSIGFIFRARIIINRRHFSFNLEELRVSAVFASSGRYIIYRILPMWEKESVPVFTF